MDQVTINDGPGDLLIAIFTPTSPEQLEAIRCQPEQL